MAKVKKKASKEDEAEFSRLLGKCDQLTGEGVVDFIEKVLETDVIFVEWHAPKGKEKNN